MKIDFDKIELFGGDLATLSCAVNGAKWQIEAERKEEEKKFKEEFKKEILEKEIPWLEKELADEYEKYREHSKISAYWLRSLCGERILKLEKEINLKKIRLKFLGLRNNEDKKIFGENIQRAKNVSLERLIEVNRAGFALCPFHQEKTPSFKIFPRENKFKCFGCGEHGDVIDLVKKQNNLDFADAVKFLNNL